jgi:hypothetical protein
VIRDHDDVIRDHGGGLRDHVDRAGITKARSAITTT